MYGTPTLSKFSFIYYAFHVGRVEKGLSAPGQTFYFSRILTEEVESPLLYLDTVNRSVAVFLDGERLYTDCPELSGGVGELTLPMLGWDRTEPVKVSLPPDYWGKTLTIAQSTGLGEKQLPEIEPTVLTPAG